jgi:acyl-ACP thioesterase
MPPAGPQSLSELVPPPAEGRVYRESPRTGIGDATPTGRIRLDAIARWLQDAAYADLVDAGFPSPAPWLVRRARIRVERFPAFDEPLELATFCSGTGPAIAERRTTIRGAAGALVEAVALWVSIDPERQRPRPLDDAFLAAFGTAAAGRRSRSRLRHPSPPDDAAPRASFAFRAADVDGAAHVNNAAYWAVLEEELTALAPGDAFDAEVEHRNPGEPAPASVLAADGMRWVVQDDAVLASFALGSSPGG